MKKKQRRGAKGARHGGHDPDKVLLGLHVTPEWKAIAKLTANRMERDVSALMIDGLKGYAKACGILDSNYKVTPAWADEIEAVAAMIRAKKTERQNNGK